MLANEHAEYSAQTSRLLPCEVVCHAELSFEVLFHSWIWIEFHLMKQTSIRK